MVLSPSMRRLIKWVGYPLLSIFAFFVFFYATFPDERLRLLLEEHGSAQLGAHVSIGEASLGPLVSLSLSDIKLEFPPPRKLPTRGFPGAAAAADDEKPAKPRKVMISEAQLSVSLLALIGGGVDMDFEASGLGGSLEGSFAASKTEGFSVEVQAQGIKLHYVPQVADAVGLPVRGKVTGKVALTVPKNRWNQASGVVDLTCEGASVGDGKAKLKIPGNPMLAMGIKMPRLRLGKLIGKINIDKGQATIEDLSARSADVELSLAGKVSLRQPVAFSMVNAYLKLKLSAELKRRDAKFELVENGLAAGKRPDGFHGLRISGTLKNTRAFPSKLDLTAGGGSPVRRRPRRIPPRRR